MKADLEVCETRDPKGLYKKARAGEIIFHISAPMRSLSVQRSSSAQRRQADQSVAELMRYVSRTAPKNGNGAA